MIDEHTHGLIYCASFDSPSKPARLNFNQFDSSTEQSTEEPIFEANNDVSIAIINFKFYSISKSLTRLHCKNSLNNLIIC